jgi:4-amino-4-deoxy-L-arabinose transferase-like glycosyltransferase
MDAPDLSFRGHLGRLALLLALVFPLFLSGLRSSECLYHMEVRSLASSQETWLRQQADPQAWLLPSWNGAPRVNKPPLVVWLNLLAWRGLPPEAPLDDLVYRARLVGVGLALLTLLCTVWAGCTLGSARLGWAAAVITGTSLFFIRQMRMASYDTYLVAFCALAVASALWAMQPAQPMQRAARHRIGWVVAGLALGLAVLAKGPLALLICGVPIVVIGLGLPRRRRLFVAGLIMLGVAALVALPWYLFILKTVPYARDLLQTEFEANRTRHAPPWYYLNILGLILPWCFWLLAGLWTGHRPRADGSTRLRSALIWFGAIFLLLSLHTAKQQRYLAPILPAAGLLVAGALLFPAFKKPGLIVRLVRFHAGFLMLLALLYGAFGGGQAWLVERGWLKQLEWVGLPGWLYPAVMPVLFLLGLAVWRHARHANREGVVWLTAGWMTLAATPALWAYSQSYHGRYEHRAEVEHIASLTRGQPFYHLTGTYTDARYVRPDPKFLLYSRRIVPPLTPHDAHRLNGPAWLTAPQHPVADDDLLRHGWRPVVDYYDQGPVRRLYHKPAA